MNTHPLRLLSIAAVLATSLLSLGCPGHGGNESKVLLVPPASPAIEGTWLATSSVESSTCPSTIPVVPIGVPTCGIAKAPLIFGMACYRGCFNECTVGSLSMLDDSVNFTLSHTIVLSGSCSLQVTEVESGSLAGPIISGSASVSVAAVGDCGPGFPCQVSGRFVLERQPSTPSLCMNVYSCGIPL